MKIRRDVTLSCSVVRLGSHKVAWIHYDRWLPSSYKCVRVKSLSQTIKISPITNITKNTTDPRVGFSFQVLDTNLDQISRAGVRVQS